MGFRARRVITEVREGRSRVVADGPAEHFVETPIGMCAADLWRIDSPPATPSSGFAGLNRGVEGSPGSALFRLVEIVPDSEILPKLPALREQVGEEVFGISLRERDFGMHASPTVDFVVVLDGEVEMHVDSDEPVRLRAGDCVIQRGARHAWRNPTERTSRIAAIVLTTRTVVHRHWLQVDRFRSGERGASEFVETRLPEAAPVAAPGAAGQFIKLSEGFASPRVRFAELPVGLVQTSHPAPEPQLVVVLSGRLEVTTADGVTKSWGSGETFIASDHDGLGHDTRVTDGPARLLFVAFDPSTDLDAWDAPASTR